MSESTTDLCYPVLTFTRIKGVLVRPPSFIQLSAAEAKPYQDAGVLGSEDDAALPPEPEDQDTPPNTPASEDAAVTAGDTDVASPLTPHTEEAPSTGVPAKGAAARKTTARKTAKK